MGIDPSDILLAGRTAVVTGGGAGIGRGIAAGLAAFGASVAIWEQDPETCASAAEEIGALGIITDVRESTEVDAALARTTSELGPVTILVNNAGGVFFSPILENAGEGLGRPLPRANLRHVFLCTQRVAQGMVDAGLGGSVRTSVTSIEGVRTLGYAAYAAAKAGVINAQTAALKLAPHGIRVNALAPDITLTEGIRAIAPPGSEDKLRVSCARWVGPATSTRWLPPRSSSPPTWPATSPVRRRFTSTAAPERPAGRVTTPRPVPTRSGRRDGRRCAARHRSPKTRPSITQETADMDDITRKVVDGTAGASSATCSPTRASRSWPMGTPTIRSTGPRATGC